MLEHDIKQYKDILNEFKTLDSADYTTAYNLSQDALVLADRWNEIMLESVKYSRDLEVTKSDFTNYCYQKYKVLMKIHDFARSTWRQGQENLRSGYYLD